MTVHAANLHDLNYRDEAAAFGPPCTPITDIHTHLRGEAAARVYADVAECYGIEHVVSMTPFDQLDTVRDMLGDRVQFIAVPDWRAEDPQHAHGTGFDERIRQFAAAGAPLCKFWAAPRALDYGRDMGDEAFLRLDGPNRTRQIELAASLGMGIMTHIADPDTWFQTTYSDTDRYDTKARQYDQLEVMLEAVPVPWLAAHMGGSPEDLDHLDVLLERYPHLYLDTSATKWMVRELSRQGTERLTTFLRRWTGRICFGSDIVTQDEHLQVDDTTDTQATTWSTKAASPAQAFDLYASRYWALRTLWERDWTGFSPIADPDLHMLDESVSELASPTLKGHALPADVLQSLYAGAAAGLLHHVQCASATNDSK
jgi:hypothetical protein